MYSNSPCDFTESYVKLNQIIGQNVPIFSSLSLIPFVVYAPPNMCLTRFFEPLASIAQPLHNYSSHQIQQQDIHSMLFLHFV